MPVDVKVAAQRAETRIGSFVKDKWQLDRLLGVGGMACVYAATHRNKKRAALKMLHRELSSDPAIRERFLREGYLANSVGHRGTVAVDDDDVAEDGSAFIVMELLDGETLDQRWRRKDRRLPLEEVLVIGDQVLETLAAAHDQGVVHRDLKPENLFLTRAGVVKLLDFGIGRQKAMKGVPSTTLSGAAMGTPAFMAPEQASGRWDEVDDQTDLWALGATLFTLLTGEYVHEGETVNETLALAVTQRARSIRALRPDLPPAAAALIDRSLQYAKPQRFADARAMQAELRRVSAELFGQGLGQAVALAVPDAEPSRPLPRAEPASQPRARSTTSRGLTASALPGAARAALAIGRRPAWSFAVAGLGLFALVALARACGAPSEQLATPPPVGSAPRAAAPVSAGLAASEGLSSASVSSALSAPPPVSIDALPREQPKKRRERAPGAAMPAKKDQPFARQR